MRTIPSGAAKFLRAAEVNCARPNKARVRPNKARSSPNKARVGPKKASGRRRPHIGPN